MTQKARKPESLVELVTHACGRPPRVEATTDPRVAIAHICGYPRADLTTLVTLGLAAAPFTLFRGLPVGFELTTTSRDQVEVMHRTLVLAVVAHLDAAARGRGYERYASLPPRGIMHNGVFLAAHAPHLLFANGLTLTPLLASRKRVGSKWIELLAAIPISDAELARYDVSPAALVNALKLEADAGPR